MKETMRVDGADRGVAFEILVDGRPLQAYGGETLAGILVAYGITAFRRTMETGLPRGQFCGMGVCFDCLVQLEDGSMVRACMTEAQAGQRISLATPDAGDLA